MSCGEPPIVDEAGGDGRKGEEVFGFAFVASMGTATSGEPGRGAVDDPSVAAQSLRGLCAPAGDTRRDAALPL